MDARNCNLVQVEPAEFMYSMLDLCATVSYLEIWKIFQFVCVIFLIDNMLFYMRNGSNAYRYFLVGKLERKPSLHVLFFIG